jgi:membrane-anchored protein YejM (alkaline phosphatase superfamily)
LNLALISIDSLRCDAVSRTNPRVRTPRFDALAASFCFTDRCFSVSSATRPVHTTLFTGLYPFEHGVVGQRTPAMRPGIPHLFGLFAGAGYQVGAFSEAPEIFAGLDYAPWIAPMAAGRVEALLRSGRRRLLFLHCWEPHAPYGAADGRALGETAALLRLGRRKEVIRRYERAVERAFETRVAPILARLDLAEWAVLICGDHGESWTAEELYHGQTLRNSVLRVPLFLHLPFSGLRSLPGELYSLVDVFPTIREVFALEVEYQGFGRDLREPERPLPYLAELTPHRPDAPGEAPLLGRRPPEPQWALFDARAKFTYWEESGQHRLERTFSEEVLPDAPETAPQYLAAHREMVSASPYGGLPGKGPEADPRLDQRLRELGYL